MSESTVGKNYLLETKLSFLIIIFTIAIIAFTVKNGMWPFLQTALPLQAEYTAWSKVGVIVGLVLPGLWLVRDWNSKVIRYNLISLITLFLLQMLTQAVVSHYFFVSMVIPSAILYISYRLIQLVKLQHILNNTVLLPGRVKWFRVVIVMISLLFWSLFWIKLTFFITPLIIYQI